MAGHWSEWQGGSDWQVEESSAQRFLRRNLLVAAWIVIALGVVIFLWSATHYGRIERDNIVHPHRVLFSGAGVAVLWLAAWWAAFRRGGNAARKAAGALGVGLLVMLLTGWAASSVSGRGSVPSYLLLAYLSASHLAYALFGSRSTPSQ